MNQHHRRTAHGPRRRRLLAGAVAAAAALVLTACGGDGSDDAGSTAETTGAGAFPVTIEHEYGSTTIEKKPERIVTLGTTDHDVLLAFGVVPVALQQWQAEFASGVGPWAESALNGQKPEVFPSGSEVSVEKVAALRPDLILAVNAGIDQALYDQLKGIAPTVAKPKGSIDWGATLEQHTTMIGKAIGQEEKAKQLVADTDARIQAAAAQYPELKGAKSIVTMPWEDGSFYVYTGADPRIELLTKLGLVMPESATALGDEEFSVQVAGEKLQMLDDAQVVTAIDIGSREKFSASPLYKQLDVVGRGDFLWLDSVPDGAAFSHNTVLSIPYVLEEIVPQLAAAVKD